MTEQEKHKGHEHHEHSVHSNHQIHDKTRDAHSDASDTTASSSDTPEDKSKARRSLITIIVAVGIMVIIIAGMIMASRYFGHKNPNTIEYNNYRFDRFEGNKWITQQVIRDQMYNIPFYYNPLEVEDIPVDPASVTLIRDFSSYNIKNNNSGTVYISVDPTESSRIVLAGVEYARILGSSYNIYNLNVKSAIHREYNDSTSEIPVMTCKNQSKNSVIIYAVVTDKNLVSVHGNCITIESVNATESIRVADAYSLRLLNIMTN